MVLISSSAGRPRFTLLATLLVALWVSTAHAATFVLNIKGGKPIVVEGELGADHIRAIERTDAILLENPGFYPEYSDDSGSYTLLPLKAVQPSKSGSACFRGFPSNPYNEADGHCVTQIHRQACYEYAYEFIWVRAGSYYRLATFVMRRYCP
jgi:hypothetical protein